jgi:hypothetical protein
MNMNLNTRKLRSDSTWAKLTPEQEEKLEGWLFEEKLGYDIVLKRAKTEWGVSSSRSSLSEYYQYLARQRRFEELAEAAEWMGQEPDPAALNLRVNQALTALLGQTAYQLALEPTDKLPLKELSSVMRSFLQLQRQRVREEHLQLEKDRAFMDATEWGDRLARREAQERPVTPERLHAMVEMLKNEMPHYASMTAELRKPAKKSKKE